MKKYLKFGVIGCMGLFAIQLVIMLIIVIMMPKQSSLEFMVKELNKQLPMRDPNIEIPFFTVESVYIENDTIVLDCTLDTAFFYSPINSIFQPESLEGGVLADGTRSDMLDIIDMADEYYELVHKCELYHFYLLCCFPNNWKYFKIV